RGERGGEAHERDLLAIYLATEASLGTERNGGRGGCEHEVDLVEDRGRCLDGCPTAAHRLQQDLRAQVLERCDREPHDVTEVCDAVAHALVVMCHLVERSEHGPRRARLRQLDGNVDELEARGL